MKKLIAIISLGVLAMTGVAYAHDTVTPYSTRGGCEAALASINNDDRDWLYENFPQLFSDRGAVMKHLHTSFQCEFSAADGAWFIVDRRFD